MSPGHSPDPARRIRVVSYNVHACIGTDGRFSPQRIADVLDVLDADIIALQEVEDRQVGGLSVSEYLADALKLAPVARTAHRRGDHDFGNLLLSRFPARATTTHNLAVAGREPRAAAEAELVVGGASLKVIATHFGLSNGERRRQVNTLLGTLNPARHDLTLLCADFNEWIPFAGIHRRLVRALGRPPAPRTFPSARPILALDRIYASPKTALIRKKAVRNRQTLTASDHLPVVAELDLNPITETNKRIRVE